MNSSNLNSSMGCPICGVKSVGPSRYPSTSFAHVTYHYLDCRICGATFVSPLPDVEAFGIMYAKESYHDLFLGFGTSRLSGTAKWIQQFLPVKSRFLDYGCGNGVLLTELRSLGYDGLGVEFGYDIAGSASAASGYVVYSSFDFDPEYHSRKFDAVVLRDVLEHLPKPYAELKKLLRVLKYDGLLFVEGPLEKNQSVVYAVFCIYRYLIRRFRGEKMATHAPFHLYMVNEHQQKSFFSRFDCLTLIHWEVFETGWPYSSGGVMKRFIALIACLFSGRKVGRFTLGNRFRAVFTARGSSYSSSPH